MSRRRNRATFEIGLERSDEGSRVMNWRKLAAVLAGTVLLSCGHAAFAQEDQQGPASYEKALKGKKVVLIPLAMGFDLAQGWAHYIKKEVEGFGGTFDTRDPNWST